MAKLSGRTSDVYPACMRLLPMVTNQYASRAVELESRKMEGVKYLEEL